MLGAWGPLVLAPKEDRATGTDPRQYPLTESRIVGITETTSYDEQWHAKSRKAVIRLVGANKETGAFDTFNAFTRGLVELINDVTIDVVQYEGKEAYDVNVTKTFNLMFQQKYVQRLAERGVRMLQKLGVTIPKGSPVERLAYLHRILDTGINSAKPGAKYRLEIDRAIKALKLPPQ
jgi:hypothetical protein